MKVMLVHAGKIRNIDPDLLASVVKIESGFRADARSKAGATGLMQLMPGTAKQLGVDAKRAEDNIKGGAAYFDNLLTQYHDDVGRALAAYNAGPAAVAKYHGIPPYRETQTYVARVLIEYNRLVKLHEAAAAVAAR
jgi:soluble lytic murein transglycosylase-like protein